MNFGNRLSRVTIPLRVNDVELRIASMVRNGTGTPLVFLHGFGSTKEDYADIIHRPELAHHAVLAYDAPGCGQSEAADLDAVSIPFLAEMARQLIVARGLARVQLIGHSMGGLTALRLATENPGLVAGFINIEGNLAPEDCFLSRQIVEHPRPSPQEFLDDFRERVWGSRFSASALYASGLPAKVRAEVVRPIFESMVELSDQAPLLDDFISLPFPRMLMYGEQNAGLSYLSRLAATGVELAKIPQCGHFPMYSNPTLMWDKISSFVRRAE